MRVKVIKHNSNIPDVIRDENEAYNQQFIFHITQNKCHLIGQDIGCGDFSSKHVSKFAGLGRRDG